MRLTATEHEIQKAILDLLAAEHVFAFRLNTAKVRAESRKGVRYFQCHSLGEGAADIRADVEIVNGGIRLGFQPLWIEIKRPGEGQSNAQVSFQQWVESKGHRYLLAESVDDVLIWLEEHR